MKRPYRVGELCVMLLLALMLLSACGGGGGGDSASPTPTSGSAPPTASNPPADVISPTVSASVSVSSDIVTFLATTNDNVGVTSVTFRLDGGAIEGTVQKSPSDGSYSLHLPINIVGTGNHTATATASDAAGNTATSSAVTFAVGNQPTVGQPADTPDTTAPTVTAAVDGNFGLVKLTAIAMDNRRIGSVAFMIDGAPLAKSVSRAYLSTDPPMQFFTKFDTTGLADGPHILVARATDTASNQTDSADIAFNVDSLAGLIEIEPNDSIEIATALTRQQLQVAGALDTVKTATGGTNVLQPDPDFYKISLAAGETVSIDMLSTLGFFLSVVDANESLLSKYGAAVFSDVSNLTYTNGSMPRDVYISVTSGPTEWAENQYKLTLTYR